MAIDWYQEDSSFRAALDDLGTMLVGEERLPIVLQRVVELAQRSIGDCDLASVTYMKDDRPETIVFTDPVANEIDDAQYENDSGPCLDAYRTRAVVSVPSICDAEEWTAFRAAALEYGVKSSYSLPMAAGEIHVGALNLYARENNAFESVPADAALAFANQAAAAVWVSRALERTRDVISHMETALGTREQIGIAIGIVMANDKVSSDDAFATLVRASQHRNVKLRDVAAEVAATGGTPD